LQEIGQIKDIEMASSAFIAKTTSANHEEFFARRCIWVNGPVIVGAGPSGLAVAAGLKERGVPFIVLERANCIASLWQTRTYDRLKLHLPKQFCQLPNFPMPDDFPEYPSKDQFIGYLESYANHFGIQPQFNESVQSAKYGETCGLWRIKTTCGAPDSSNKREVEYICRWIVVATGENAEKVVPKFFGFHEFGGDIIHACDYKSGDKYRGQRVLVVGCGNSGMEVSLDLCNYDAMPFLVCRSSVSIVTAISHFCLNFTYTMLVFSRGAKELTNGGNLGWDQVWQSHFWCGSHIPIRACCLENIINKRVK